jgi:hypothetical protein
MNFKYETIGFLGVIIVGSLMLSQMGMAEGMTEGATDMEKVVDKANNAGIAAAKAPDILQRDLIAKIRILYENVENGRKPNNNINKINEINESIPDSMM